MKERECEKNQQSGQTQLEPLREGALIELFRTSSAVTYSTNGRKLLRPVVPFAFVADRWIDNGMNLRVFAAGSRFLFEFAGAGVAAKLLADGGKCPEWSLSAALRTLSAKHWVRL